jgi:hypothetical protein
MVQAYCAKKPYLQPSIVTLAQLPLPWKLIKSASPLKHTDASTETFDGHSRGEPVEHQPMLWSSENGPQEPMSQ